MAYRAEIEIGVKGQQKIQRLSSEINKSAKAVDSLAGSLGSRGVVSQSLNNFDKLLKRTKQTLASVIAGTDAEKKAVKEYVTVLGQANSFQERQNKLIEEEIRQRNGATAALKKYNAAAVPGRRPGGSMAGRYLRPGQARGTTQFGGPIGPGPASATALSSRLPARSRFFGGTQFPGPIGPGPASSIFGGQSSAVEGRIKRILAIKKDELKLEKALIGLQQKSKGLDAESIKENNRLLNLKADEVARNKEIIRQEQVKQSILRKRQKLEAAGRTPGGRRRRRGGQRFTDIATGAGFPLLFGGGPLQALAGGIGGAKFGLGGAIAASAITSQVQQFVQGIAEAGQALDAFSGDVGKIAEMTGTAGNESIKYAKALEDLGFKQSALQIAAQQAAQVIGTQGVGALQLFAEDTKRLSEATARVGLKIQAFFAQALGGFTNFIAQIVEKIGGAKPADTGSAPARALAINQVTKFNRQELDILRQEFEIKKLIGEEDAKQRQVAEAKLAISRLDLQIRKEKSKAVMAAKQNDIAGELQAENAAFLLGTKRQILELELSQAEAAKRVFDQYTAQVEALKNVVHQSQMRLNQEKAFAQGQSKINQAFFSAQLKINSLAIQRARQKNNLNEVLRLEIEQAKIVYNQTLQQIRAEFERVALKARELRVQVKIAEAAFLERRARGEANKDDQRALQAKYQALKIANQNVKTQAKVFEFQVKGAKATYSASVEAAKFASQQERASRAAQKTANAMQRISGGGKGSAGGATRSAGKEDFGTFKRVTGMDFAMSRDVYGRPIKRYASEYGFTSTPLAEGSYVTRPTNALVGERGENEYVIPESKMNSAIKRYTRGARGESVVEGSGETSAAGRKVPGATVNISTGPVMRMDDQDYVTVSDLNDAVGSVAAAMSSGSEVYGGSTRLS